VRIPSIDLAAEYRSIQPEIDMAIRSVLESGSFINGENVQAFEAEAASYLGVKHAVGCGNGSDALLLALMALHVGPGDCVITTTHSFFATAGSIARLGATPVFADIDPDTYALATGDLPRAESWATGPVKAVIPVHLYGQCADMDPILEYAHRRGWAVIEDTAQAFGATYKGRQAGTMGDMGTFSFFPTKNLGCYGDGGMVVTSDDAIADELRLLRAHGARRKYFSEEVGINSRLDEIQAAILRVKLCHVDSWLEHKCALAHAYDSALGALAGMVQPPRVAPTNTHTYHQYTVRVKNGHRDALQEYLAQQGIASSVYYPQLLHLQTCFASLGYKYGDMPVAERALGEILSLPMWSEMSSDDVPAVVAAISSYLETVRAGEGA
jgi:dTDP-4-amino-4,6-dideoxygalactose transaminase